MKYNRHWQMKQEFLKKRQISNKELCETFSISIETPAPEKSITDVFDKVRD